MKIQPYIEQNYSKKYNSYTTNNINFEGIHLKSSKAQEKFFNDFVYDIANKLRISEADVIERVQRFNELRQDLLEHLTDRYNAKYSRSKNPEDPNIVLNIYDLVKKPNIEHFNIVSRVHGSFEQIQEIFTLATSKKDLAIVSKLQLEIYRDKTIPRQIIKDLFASPNKKEYIKHFDKYKSYLRLNSKNENAVSELDKLIEDGTYSQSKYYTIEKVNRLFENSLIRKHLSQYREVFEQYPSAEGRSFIDIFFNSYYPSRANLDKVDMEDIISIYQTTTAKNYGIRSDLLSKFNRAEINTSEEKAAEIKTMRNVFELLDENKFARKFVEKLIEKSIDVSSARELAEIFETISPEKAYRFRDNIFNILKKTKRGEARNSFLVEHATNPFFETRASYITKQERIRYGFEQKESIFSKAKKALKNRFKIFTYNIFSSDAKPVENLSVEIKPVETKIERTIDALHEKPEELANVIETPIEKIENEIVQEEPEVQAITEPIFTFSDIKFLPLPKPKHPELNIDFKQMFDNIFKLPSYIFRENPKPFVFSDIKLLEYKPEGGIKLVNRNKETAQARKLRVISDVNDIIGKKLGAKTLDRQQETYSKNATKMRLKLLPEIFDSIKETSKTNRSKGIRPRSQNKDVVRLYERIKGNNRKLVRYMLMKRNVEGERMFEVKDIISLIDKSNAEIAKIKQQDPNFRAADAKAYYDAIFDEMVAKYGKVKRVRTKKSS